MTQPAVPPDPTLAAAAPAVGVRLRRGAVDRLWGSIMAMHALLVALVLAAIGWVISLDVGMPLLAVSPFLIVLLGEALQIAITASLWHGLRSVPEPLVLTPSGLVLRSRQGEIGCPWEAVTSIRIERRLLGRLLRVRLHPAARPGAPGITSTMSRSGWRAARSGGMRYSLRILDVSEPDLRALVAQQSGGRVAVG